MSKKQHQKQVDKARARRRQQQAFARKQRRQKVIILVMVALMVLSLVAVGLGSLFAGDGTPTPEVDPVDDPAADAPEGEQAAAEGPCPSPGDDVPEATSEPYDDPPRYDVDPDATYRVRLETTCGDVVVELDTEGSPRTAENFLALVDDGYYEGVPFHRTIAGFMIQGGDPTGTGTGCVDAGCETRLPGYSFEDELETAAALPEHDQPGLVVYPRGAIAMANSGADTQGSQFFLMHEDSPLPPDYTLFGEIVEGLEVVDDIATGAVAGDQALDPVIVLRGEIEQG